MSKAHLHTPIGWIALQEEQGSLIAAIFLDDEPNTDDIALSPALENYLQEMRSYFEGNIEAFASLAHYAQPGTDFQQKVWQQLTVIPYGKTISYRELAIRLGDEKCIRAAASANGQNNLAIIIPCHRVIGSDGSLTGYAGGLWRKKWLLEHEARYSGKAVQSSLGF